MAKVKVCCHSCDGQGKVKEQEYPSGKAIFVVCPECDGKKWVFADGVS